MQGFDKHVDTEHNMWDYVYYARYLDTIDTNNHTAIQKYVHDKVSIQLSYNNLPWGLKYSTQ